MHRDAWQPLEPLFTDLRPEVVIYLAAQVSVPDSIKDPYKDLAINVGGTINIMTAAAATGTRKVIAVSSAAVYGIPRSIPITEEAPTLPVSPYGLSKLTMEHYVRLLGSTLGVQYTIMRPANIYGPRQATKGDGAVIPAFLARFMAKQDPVIHGDGTQTRDFLYVADMARAILAAINRGNGLTLNISSGTGTSIKELWRHLAGLLHWNRTPVYGSPRLEDIPHSVLDDSKARAVLEWEPRVKLDEGLIQCTLGTND